MKRTIVGLTLVSALFASTCLGQACSAPDNAITCRRMNVTLNPSSALNSSLFVFQADPDPQPNCQDSQWRLDVVVCLDAPNATLPYILELALPAAHKAIELRVEVRGTMPNQPLRLKIRGANGLDGPPADDYNRAELYELAIHPDSDVHVELTGWLSNFGRIECASVTELVLLNDVAESAGSNCGSSNEKVIGAGLNSLPPLLLVRNNPNRGSSLPVFDKGIAVVSTRSRRTDQCINFLPTVSVENGPITLWNFPANWKIQSDYFEAKHATTGNFVSITAGQIGPAILTGGPVQMQAKNIDTLTTTAGGVYADIFAETIDSASGTGINALQGLSGSITADAVVDGSQIRFSNPSGLNGVTAGSVIRLKSLPAGAVIDLPANGLQGQIILNAENDVAPGDAWGGQIKVNGVEIAHSGAQYTPLTVSTAAHGGGSVGLVRYERHNADCSPLDGGLRTLGDFFSGSHPVVIEYYGPVKDNDTLAATPPVKIEWTDTHNTTYNLTDPDQYTNIGGQVFSVSLSGRKVVITPHAGRQIWGFPLGTFTVTPRAGRLACDQLNGISPDVDSAAYTFIIQPACAGGNTPGMVTDCDGDEIIDLCETADPPSCGTCRADVNNDGEVNPDDLGDFINLYFLQGTDRYGPGFYALVGYWPNFFGWKADFNQDGDLNPDDLGDYINAYFGAGCG